MCSSVSLVYHVSVILAFLMMIVKHVFAGEPVIRYQTAAAGVILSPLYPDSEYPPSLNVEWRFRLFPGDTFELDLDRLSPHGLSKAEGDTDRVELVLESGARREVVTLMHAGPEPNKNLSDHIANGGAWFNKTAIGAQEARVTLRFHSDSSGSGVGFRAHYRISCTNASAQCLNGGTCEPQRTYDPFQADVRQEEPLCHCPDQFTGERCETYLPCYELACEPGATCHSDLAAGTVSCRCVRDGYMDLQGRCVDVDECSLSLNSPPSAGKARCPGNHVCVNTPGSFTCVCGEGYRKKITFEGTGNDLKNIDKIDPQQDACVPIECPDSTWVWHDGSCYWFDPEPVLYGRQDAVDLCDQKNGSSLVWILSEEENTFVGVSAVQPIVWIGVDPSQNSFLGGHLDYPAAVESPVTKSTYPLLHQNVPETSLSFKPRTKRFKKRTISPSKSAAAASSTRKYPESSTNAITSGTMSGTTGSPSIADAEPDVRRAPAWLSGQPMVFTNWGPKRNDSSGQIRTGFRRSTAPNFALVPNRWGQAGCSAKKRFICQAPEEYCPYFWSQGKAEKKCYYKSSYAVDVATAREICEYLAIRGNLLRIDSLAEMMELSSWEFWKDATASKGSLAHYWIDLAKVSVTSSWMWYTPATRPKFTRWDKGLMDSAPDFPDSAHPLCSYMFPNQWVVSWDSPEYAGVVCKAPPIIADDFSIVATDDAAHDFQPLFLGGGHSSSSASDKAVVDQIREAKDNLIDTVLKAQENENQRNAILIDLPMSVDDDVGSDDIEASLDPDD